jgi:hypothetical protein
MDVRVLLPSLANLPVFYAHSTLLLLLFSVSSYALLLRLRTGRSGARPALRFPTRLAVLLPAWGLWAVSSFTTASRRNGGTALEIAYGTGRLL